MDDRLTGGQECREPYCGKPLHRIGDSLYCNSETCARFALPVDLNGRTEEEALAHAVAPLVADEGAESESEMDDATGVRS